MARHSAWHAPELHRLCLGRAAGAALLFANNLYVGNARGYSLKEADVAIVVCLRHLATAFAFNDVVWASTARR